MKITGVTTYVVDADWRNWVFVQVLTDEGLTGVGEASLEGCDEQIVAALQRMKAYLIGKDPLDIEAHRRALYDSRFWRGMVLLSALGGLEMALWDIAGKALGAPVYRLLGGACREQVRCYTHISEAVSGHSIQQRVEEAQQAVSEGWSALKWDPLPQSGRTLEPAELRFVAKQVEAVRAAVGDDVELMVEIHGRLDPATAIRVANAIAPYRPYFMEEPVPPESLDALEAVARHAGVPLATGERILTKEAFWPLLERQLVAYIQPDVIHVGGILESKKIAAMAEARYIGVAPHNPNGPVATAATLHLCANIPNLAIMEMPCDDYLWAARWRDDLLLDPGPVQVRDGCLALPARAGLGVELNIAALATYPARVRDWGVSYQSETVVLE
jgi:galactonate dehydratase